MIESLALQAGDSVGIISTARWVDEELVSFAVDKIQSWGFHVVKGNSLQERDHQFAGNDSTRLQDLQHFLDNPEIKAIICARGGYGTIRIMDQINFDGFMARPKFICGFSDITVLHMHINDKLGIPSIHSCMPVNFKENTSESIESLQKVLCGIHPEFNLPMHPLNKTGNAEGIITGGNLSILYSLLGTKFGFSTVGKILFIEDVDEYVYHVDRMMMSLNLSGKLQHLSGVIVGGMTKMKDNEVPFGKDGESIIGEYFSDLHIPVCFGFPAGHIQDNRAFFTGVKIKLHVDDRGASIRYE